VKRDLYAEVSTRIVAELEAGAAPWVKPWSETPGANTPCNAVTNRPYSGCNVVLLWMAQAAGYRTPRFLTYDQALELGGNVRRGERDPSRSLFAIEACARARRFAFATSPSESVLRMCLVIGTERGAQHSSAAHQKEGPDRASKTRTGDEQAASPCRRSDVLAMREKS
jgi:hypothetical protein